MLTSLNAIDRKMPCAVIVRHAARYPIDDIRKSLEVGLTDEGMEDARRFGSALRGFNRVRFFHSPAVRCRETAESMRQGVEGNGTITSLTGPEHNLCAPYLKEEACLIKVAKDGQQFIRAWFEGRFNEDHIMGTSKAADMVLSPIVDRLTEPGGKGRLDVHVSHEWEINLLREELLGIRYEDAGWPPFLDGILFQPNESGFLAHYRSSVAPFCMVEARRIESSL